MIDRRAWSMSLMRVVS